MAVIDILNLEPSAINASLSGKSILLAGEPKKILGLNVVIY